MKNIAKTSIKLFLVFMFAISVLSTTACASTEDTVVNNIVVLYALAIMATVVGLAFVMSGSISIPGFISIAIITIIGVIAIQIIATA